MVLFCQTVDLCLMSCFCRFQHLVISVQPGVCGDRKAGIHKTLLNIDDLAGVYVAGTGSALDRMSCTCSVKSHFSDGL